METAIRVAWIFVIAFFAGTTGLRADELLIRIGFNIPQSGSLAVVGEHAKNGAELVKREIDLAGGLQVGEKRYKVVFSYGDNGSNPAKAMSLAVEQISREQILGMIGPLSSGQAVPTGQIANSFAVPMISPWATAPLTTKDRPYVFSCCVLYTLQGPVIAKFATGEFKARKAAVLYDIVSAYPRGMAGIFKESFEATNGRGSVVAFEEFRTGDKDYGKQLQRIKDSGAEFLFTPQFAGEVPSIIRQAQALGITIPIAGGGSWAGGDLMAVCGDDCKGRFFVGNYAPGNATGLNKKFVEVYKETYGMLPDEPAALTWDATRLLLEAVRDTGGLSGNLVTDRQAVRKALSEIRDFDGAAGPIGFKESNNPSRCPIIVKIDENGVFAFHDAICP